MLPTILCDYSNAYMLLSGTITITEAGDNDAARKFAPFTDCISEINKTQIDNAKYIDVVMPMYNFIEYGQNYSQTCGSLQQYYRGDPNDTIIRAESFKYKIKITGKPPADGNTKDIKIAGPLKYLSNFWRTLKSC